jgi:hypothetical protein
MGCHQLPQKCHGKEGVGKVETASGEVSTGDTPLAQLSREERNALIAAGLAELRAMGGEDTQPS